MNLSLTLLIAVGVASRSLAGALASPDAVSGPADMHMGHMGVVPADEERHLRAPASHEMQAENDYDTTFYTYGKCQPDGYDCSLQCQNGETYFMYAVRSFVCL
jgi:hypothetical protein